MRGESPRPVCRNCWRPPPDGGRVGLSGSVLSRRGSVGAVDPKARCRREWVHDPHVCPGPSAFVRGQVRLALRLAPRDRMTPRGPVQAWDFSSEPTFPELVGIGAALSPNRTGLLELVARGSPIAIPGTGVPVHRATSNFWSAEHSRPNPGQLGRSPGQIWVKAPSAVGKPPVRSNPGQNMATYAQFGIEIGPGSTF